MRKVKLLTIVFCLFQLINCYSQKKIKLEYQNDNLLNEIGIGLVQQISSSEKIVLYEDSELKFIKSRDAKIGKEIIPLLNKIDYNILFFLCVEKNINFFKIAISNGKYAYIKPSGKYVFYNWNDFLKNQVTSVESKDKKSKCLFDRIKGNPITFKNLQRDDEIEIIEIKGDWLQIKNDTINKKYWIKWKGKKEFLIYFNLLI